MRRQHRIGRDSAPAARTPALRLAKYLWAVVPWVIVAAFVFLAVKLIAAAP
jgi:hypothetical protein